MLLLAIKEDGYQLLFPIFKIKVQKCYSQIYFDLKFKVKKVFIYCSELKYEKVCHCYYLMATSCWGNWNYFKSAFVAFVLNGCRFWYPWCKSVYNLEPNSPTFFVFNSPCVLWQRLDTSWYLKGCYTTFYSPECLLQHDMIVCISWHLVHSVVWSALCSHPLVTLKVISILLMNFFWREYKHNGRTSLST